MKRLQFLFNYMLILFQINDMRILSFLVEHAIKIYQYILFISKFYCTKTL